MNLSKYRNQEYFTHRQYKSCKKKKSCLLQKNIHENIIDLLFNVIFPVENFHGFTFKSKKCEAVPAVGDKSSEIKPSGHHQTIPTNISIKFVPYTQTCVLNQNLL